MATLTDILGQRTPEDVILAVCVSICGLSLTGLWMLARPTSWLSKRIDRAVELPARERSLR